MGDTRIKSVFGDAAQQLQVLIDARADKFAPTFFQQYFDWGTPQVGLSYATIIGRTRIEAAASIVARESGAPVRGRLGLDKLQGEVAAIKVARALRESDYRNYMTIAALNGVSDKARLQQVLQLIWNDLNYCGVACLKRLDIMAAQALSTGIISIDSTTNPDGTADGDIDLLLNPLNKVKVAVVWSDANKATMTPMADIKAAIQAAELRGISFAKILIPKAMFYTVASCTEVNNYLKAFLRIGNGNIQPTLAQINEYMTANLFPVFEIIDVVTAIEKDGVPTAMRPWKAANVTLVPDGKLGIIHRAFAMEEMKPVEGISYGNYQNVLVSKWSENNPFREWTMAEINAFPGLEAIDSMYIITTDTAA